MPPVSRQLVALAEKYCKEGTTISLSHKFDVLETREERPWDCLDTVEFVLDAEGIYDIVIPDEDADSFECIQDVVDYIVKVGTERAKTGQFKASYGTPAQQLWHQYQQPLRQWDTSDWGPSGGEQTWYGEEENLACSASPAHQAPPVCSTSTETPTASSDIPTVRLTVGQWLLLPVHRRPEPPPQQEEGQQEEQQPHQLQEAPREKQQVTGRSGQGSDTQGAIGLQTFTIEASEDISASLAAAFPLFNPPRDAAAPPLAVASAAWNAIPTAAASAFLTPCPPPFSYRPAAAPALELASHMTAATAEGQRLCIKVRLDGMREVLPAEALWNVISFCASLGGLGGSALGRRFLRGPLISTDADALETPPSPRSETGERRLQQPQQRLQQEQQHQQHQQHKQQQQLLPELLGCSLRHSRLAREAAADAQRLLQEDSPTEAHPLQGAAVAVAATEEDRGGKLVAAFLELASVALETMATGQHQLLHLLHIYSACCLLSGSTAVDSAAAAAAADAAAQAAKTALITEREAPSTTATSAAHRDEVVTVIASGPPSAAAAAAAATATARLALYCLLVSAGSRLKAAVAEGPLPLLSAMAHRYQDFPLLEACYWQLRALVLKQKVSKEWVQQQGAEAPAEGGAPCLVWGPFMAPFSCFEAIVTAERQRKALCLGSPMG
ncbi:uncharacterized protein LOC34623165 [Cyclospora cayetanensis]|uniref:Uncharacterized protein LOC34623165 n=1 Tax=Cyclospora cayetanensis TaxID=88456 RepID=A0A6P6S349_9EIME|nr:uncharacterized protein LOC34623165 [Cyclospora cayetanensis]